MTSPARHSRLGHAFFITFSCYKRRRILDEDAPKKIVMEILASQLRKQNAKCQGYVLMPDHVHAMIWFSAPDQLSTFMKLWKQRSSLQIKKNMREHRTGYLNRVSLKDPIWQAGYYSFNLYSDWKVRQKLDYMHHNPVKAGLVSTPENWHFSSARHYSLGAEVGVPIKQPEQGCSLEV